MPNARTTIVPVAGTPFVNQAFAPLCLRFLPLAAFALKAAAASDARTLSWDECQTRLDALADEELAIPLPQDMLPEDMASCRMACYTLVDEVLNASPRPGETVPGWATRGLQARRLGTSTGGADFFARLEDLLARAFEETQSLPEGQLLLAPGDLSHAHAASLPEQPRRPRIQGPAAMATAMASLARGGGSGPSARSAALACGVFALCLLLGLRGQYYGQARDSEIARLREAAGFLLVGWTGPDSQPMPAAQAEYGANGSPDGVQPPRRGLLGRTLGALGGAGALFVAIPFILTGLWYLVCATIVARIPLP